MLTRLRAASPALVVVRPHVHLRFDCEYIGLAGRVAILRGRVELELDSDTNPCGCLGRRPKQGWFVLFGEDLKVSYGCLGRRPKQAGLCCLAT